MPVIGPVKYSEIRSQLNTGDILGFEGTEPLDFMINLLEEGRYSHVGMVLKDEQGELWFWDAPGGGRTFPDPYWQGSGPNPGARVANLDCLLEYYCSIMSISTFSWRQLTPSLKLTTDSSLAQFIGVMDGTLFPGNNCELPQALEALLEKYLSTANMGALTLGIGLLLTYLTGAVLLVPVVEYTFCAQLVALTYMDAGLLPVPGVPNTNKTLPANGYTPAMFMDQPQPLVLEGGATLTTPVMVTWDGSCTEVQATEQVMDRPGVQNPLQPLL